MKKISTLCGFLLFLSLGRSQNVFKVKVSSGETKAPLAGASLNFSELKKGLISDSSGYAIFHNLPAGTYTLEVSYIGYATQRKNISIPITKEEVDFELEAEDEESNPDVVVTSMRTDRSVKKTPTRIEVIAGGEISENISMRPGEIRMLLNETMGIIAQQISATSNTANIRMQELEGRYTQILRDGFPLYAGLSEGLSLVQIAPLDLRQVEIIKGSASTLYGAGAITGLINLVSKTPADGKELSFLANGTTTKGLDLSGFYADQYGKIGLSLFASRNSGEAYDPSGTGLTAIPKFTRYTVTPRIFFYGKNLSINLGVGYITEDRLGGYINYVDHGEAGYFEHNMSKRFTTQLGITQKTGKNSSIVFKNSYNHFSRDITIPGYEFKGIQQSSFSELSWNSGSAQTHWVAGLNYYTDNFSESNRAPDSVRDYRHATYGIFVQNTSNLSRVMTLESGLRTDYTDKYGVIFLPRLFLLANFNDNLYSRIGGGFGYEIPSIFTEESEERQYRNILPISSTSLYERSAGLTFDFTYRLRLDELNVIINPLVFYTRINDPLVLEPIQGGLSQFINAQGYTDSKGFEITIRWVYNKFRLFTGYSYTEATNHFSGTNSWYPLAPYNMLHFDLVYELEKNLRVALEAYYTGKQELHDSTTGHPYWLVGALIEKTFKHVSIFVNTENLADVRQTRWGPIYTGKIDDPNFRDIYAPLDGFILNTGIKLKW
jgi:iron complex outermembrane receptor protein